MGEGGEGGERSVRCCDVPFNFFFACVSAKPNDHSLPTAKALCALRLHDDAKDRLHFLLRV